MIGIADAQGMHLARATESSPHVIEIRGAGDLRNASAGLARLETNQVPPYDRQPRRLRWEAIRLGAHSPSHKPIKPMPGGKAMVSYVNALDERTVHSNYAWIDFMRSRLLIKGKVLEISANDTVGASRRQPV